MRLQLMTERVYRGGNRKGFEAYLPGHAHLFAPGATAHSAAQAFAKWYSEQIGKPCKVIETIGGEYDLLIEETAPANDDTE